MTDLSKGIIEINGFEINANTVTTDIICNLKSVYKYCLVTVDERCEIFVFENIPILDRIFNVDVTFENEEIIDIQLNPTFEDLEPVYEKCFIFDCMWLKGLFGCPNIIGINNVQYNFDYTQINVVKCEYDGLYGPDEHILINYLKAS